MADGAVNNRSKKSASPQKILSPTKMPSPDDIDSWLFSPTKAFSNISELTLGALLKSDPGTLLQVLDDNLHEILTLNPELENQLDPVPLYPSSVSLKDLNDFYGMMECEIFFNYINLFLNLPIFGRRMTYQTGLRQFSLDPPLKRRKFRIDHGMVTSWIVVNRLPYFLKSSLYLEYRFSYELLHDLSFDGRSLHLVLELKGPIGVNRFRIFLASRDLAKLVSFWMDCERFQLMSDDKSRKECFNAIEILYLKYGSRFELPDTIREGIMGKIEKEPVSSIVEVMVHGVPLLERIKKKEVDKIKNFEIVGFLLKTAQEEVMTFLRNYWIPRYFTRNGSPYTDSRPSLEKKSKSHLIWGIDHKAPAPEPVKLIGFSGQAPNDFESVGERIQAQQSQIAQGNLPNSDMSSIWNLDLSKKGVNAKRKEKKALKKYTLFEQARKKSMMPRPSTLGEGMGNMFSQQSLLAGRGGMDQRRSTTFTQCGSSYPTLEPLGVDFKMNGQDNTSIPSIAVPSVLRRMSRSKTLIPSKTPSLKPSSPLACSSPDLKLPPVGEIPSSPSISENEPSDEDDVVLELPKIVEEVDKEKRKKSDQLLLVLPTLTKRSSPGSSSSSTFRSNVISTNEDDTGIWDPYLLLELVNPDLITRPTIEQLNTRKWILGALAASCLIGNPLKDFLSSYCYTNKAESEKKESEDEEDEKASAHQDQSEVALNNLDCWQRIERIRSTAGTSHAGRRAEEITNAGGWGGLDSPHLLPNFHYYLASLSGDLLEAHLEPYIEMRFIAKTYLDTPEKLDIDIEVMVVLREMFKSRSVNDSWFALLQEHNFTVLKEHVLKYLLWDDKMMLLNCAPSKHTTCRHRVRKTALSATAVDEDALSEEVERDLTNQFIFAPKSEGVWLSLFALEVSGYRPAEVYFPPMPTTTKSIGCCCDEESLYYDKFDMKDRRERGIRPRSTLMTESQANLPTLEDCRTSPVKKRTRLIKPTLLNRSDSRNSSIFGGTSQLSLLSGKESNTSATSIDDKERKGSHLNRPYPSSFKQVLSDPKSFAMFMKFLEMNLADENEAPLINFWHQIEIMKSYTNFKARKEKAHSIHRKYLYSGNTNCVMKNYLKANAEICPQLTEISEKKNVSPNMMANAQTFVCKLLEDRWWSGYKTVWNDEKSARIILSATTTEAPNANISYGKHYRAHIRYLWGNFTFDLMNFQRGLENQSVFLQFKSFLKKTATKLKEMKGRRSKEHGVATNINGITVFVERLSSDVEFFTEINRWISIKCGMSHGKRGKLLRESELLLTKKADAIVSCYLRSCVPPKVCVNLPQRIIDDIEKRLDDPRKFNRCLFYHAVLHMITILLPFWKKFCFILSARGSSKDQSLIQTVSGQAISRASLVQPHSSTLSEKEYDCLNKQIDKIKKGPREDIKGMRKRLGTAFKRRDAVLQHASSTEHNIAGTGRIVCQFSLMDGMCHVKHESGLEVPHPCETLLNPWSDKIEYLISPLPRVKSRIGTPPSKRAKSKETAHPSKSVKI